jgi:transcriptional regulator with XRE-family HTH domain
METDKAFDAAIGTELFRYRKVERRLSRQQLHELTGMGLSTIQRFEEGERSPTVQQLRQLSRALGFTLSTLVIAAEARLKDPERGEVDGGGQQSNGVEH